MTRISDSFARSRSRGETALIPFVTAGHPSLEFSERLVLEFDRGGADIVELGVPFSDPLADGPTIQLASECALKQGVTLKRILEMISRLRQRCELPIVLMSYYNPILQYGLEAFAEGASRAGVDGLIISDLPPEESTHWLVPARAHGLDTIFLLAPTSTEERVRLVADQCRGFVYCVSRTGVTGERTAVPADLKNLVSRIKGQCPQPVAVGFGISTPDHVRQIVTTTGADGVVVGSAIVRLLSEKEPENTLQGKARRLVEELKQATRNDGVRHVLE